MTNTGVSNDTSLAIWASPLGRIRLLVSDLGLVRLDFVDDNSVADADGPDHPVLRETIRQLDAYFAGQRATFEIPLDLRGTPFQNACWLALTDIPCGETITYRELAARVGRPTAIRAVGTANGANPISVIVPCHRVIGTDGTLRGYGGGLERKERLLALERYVTRPSEREMPRWLEDYLDNAEADAALQKAERLGFVSLEVIQAREEIR